MFWRSDKPRERIAADAFLQGVKKYGDDGFEMPLTWEIPEPIPNCDVACMVGVKSKRRFDACWSKGVHTLMFDKGYVREQVRPTGIWKYWRVAFDGHHPTAYLMKLGVGDDRWRRLGLSFKPWARSDSGRDRIVFAGSSEKYHEFHELPHPTQYAGKIINKIGKRWSGAVIYRPKPSWDGADSIPGAIFSKGRSIIDDLDQSCFLITHGSNAVFEALLEGVPSIVLGDAVTKPISSTAVEDMPEVVYASDKDRQQLLNALAYSQWTIEEFASGEAWAFLREKVLHHCA